MMSQAEKGKIFRDLHAAPNCFVMPNPWDIGSAKILAQMGFKALATTSAGLAFSLGRHDGSKEVDRREILENAADIVAATPLPVSADLENGYGDDPEIVAQTIHLAADSGLVGASIEDFSGELSKPIYPLEQATDRIEAAVAAARSLDFPFTLTARAENYLYGQRDLGATITRLQAFQQAGADVLYAPGLSSLEEIQSLVNALDCPVNVVMGLAGASLSLTELEDAGVKRISLGSSFSRAAFGAMINAAREVMQHGTFTFATEAPSIKDMYRAFGADH